MEKKSNGIYLKTLWEDWEHRSCFHHSSLISNFKRIFDRPQQINLNTKRCYEVASAREKEISWENFSKVVYTKRVDILFWSDQPHGMRDQRSKCVSQFRALPDCGKRSSFQLFAVETYDRFVDVLSFSFDWRRCATLSLNWNLITRHKNQVNSLSFEMQWN